MVSSLEVVEVVEVVAGFLIVGGKNPAVNRRRRRGAIFTALSSSLAPVSSCTELKPKVLPTIIRLARQARPLRLDLPTVRTLE
ncbi:hypothetical protein [Polaromonas naphthalenivorans]|uniref:hypothetical protein n=1 Tax=Polaromonas naphthalenivorans TaxID=216465 RepID=UPI00059D8D63|nr:hypothetical protein [Polaromonas naphthalenivorans]